MKLLIAILFLAGAVICTVAQVVPGPAEKKTVEDIQAEINKLGKKDKKQFNAEYDKFRDETKTRVVVQLETWGNKEMKNPPDSLDWMLHSYFDGKLITNEPKSNIFCAATASKKWRYLYSHDLILLVDPEKKINLSKGSHDGTVTRYGVNELMCWPIENDVLKVLVKAKTVEFQLGGTEGTIPPEKLELLRQYGLLLSIE